MYAFAVVNSLTLEDSEVIVMLRDFILEYPRIFEKDKHFTHITNQEKNTVHSRTLSFEKYAFAMSTPHNTSHIETVSLLSDIRVYIVSETNGKYIVYNSV
jgi:hypothetical protein